MDSQTFDATMAAVGSKTTQAGAGASIVGWLLSSEFGVLCGVVIGLAGLAVNVYFKIRNDRRSQVEHEARMEALRGREG